MIATSPEPTVTSAATPTSAVRLEGTRFGAIVFDPAEAVEFPDGIIGFETSRRFITVSAGEGSPFRWLQSLDDPALAFLLADPDAFVPTYVPTLPEGALEDLGIAPEAPYILWVTANVPAGRPRDATLNLLAPIVLNPIARRGAQIVLHTDAYTIRHRAFPQAAEPATAPGSGDRARRAA